MRKTNKPTRALIPLPGIINGSIYRHGRQDIADKSLAKPDLFSLTGEEASIYVTRKEKLLFELWLFLGFKSNR